MYVLQNWVCSTSPPGVGEQQVFWIAVVFSHEKMEGCKAQEVILGFVLGSENMEKSAKPRTEGAKRTEMKTRLVMVSVGFILDDGSQDN